MGRRTVPLARLRRPSRCSRRVAGVNGGGLKDQNLVNGQRQKIQLELAFSEGNESEALPDSEAGTEPHTATTNSNGPVKLVSLIEEVRDLQNLNQADSEILSNKGAHTPGVDGMTVPQLKAYV